MTLGVVRVTASSYQRLGLSTNHIVSELDWAIVSPPPLTREARDGRHRVNADLADHLLKTAEDRTTVGCRMFLAR